VGIVCLADLELPISDKLLKAAGVIGDYALAFRHAQKEWVELYGSKDGSVNPKAEDRPWKLTSRTSRPPRRALPSACGKLDIC